MKIIVTGGSGFIGDRLTAALLQRGHRVLVLDHNPPRQKVDFIPINLAGEALPPPLFDGVEAVIHLAGRSIFGRWNEQIKTEIRDSRILSTRAIVSSMASLERPPHVLVSASAVGFYGERGEEELDESATPGSDFLSKVCADWEAEAQRAGTVGLRTVQVRTAPVIGQRGGMMGQLLPVFKWGIGGPLGSGRQWFPWIHINDIVGIYVMAVENETVSGPVNACAPGLVRNKEFATALGRALYRPSFIKTPSWALRLAFDGMADFILASQKVAPRKALASGYKFSFTDINAALADVLGKTKATKS